MSTYTGVTNFQKTVRSLAHPVYVCMDVTICSFKLPTPTTAKHRVFDDQPCLKQAADVALNRGYM